MNTRIAQILEKCKQAGEAALLRARNVLKNEDIFIITVIILVGFGGFGLGRLSKLHEEKSLVVINGAPASARAGGAENEVENYESGIMSEGKNFVASVSGTKYHLPWCASAERIKEENKIWFATEDEARAAGYSPAGNCSGL